MSKAVHWVEQTEIESRICELAIKHTGVDEDEAVPSARLIEDLGCDSLDLIEFIMEIEDAFSMTIPDTPVTPVGKLIFTQRQLRLRDIAEYVFLNQDTGKPVRIRRRWSHRKVTQAKESGFTQLGGKYTPPNHNSSKYAPLDHKGEFPMFRREIDGMVCVQIPAQVASVGSDDPRSHADAKPKHIVHLPSFLIDIEPVSVVAFCRFLNSADLTRSEADDLIELAANDDRAVNLQWEPRNGIWCPKPRSAMQPVVMVSWHAASAYASWANGVDWRNSDRCFLPSETQWECAAEGAFDDHDSVYAGIHERGRSYEVDGLPLPAVQEPFGGSRFGLRHMSGTIWHWCRDWYSPEAYHAEDGNLQNTGSQRATGVRSERGGSWVGPIELCHPSYRRGRNPDAKGRCLGFRCVGDAPAS